MLGSSKSKPQGRGLSNDIVNYLTAIRSEANGSAGLKGESCRLKY